MEEHSCQSITLIHFLSQSAFLLSASFMAHAYRIFHIDRDMRCAFSPGQHVVKSSNHTHIVVSASPCQHSQESLTALISLVHSTWHTAAALNLGSACVQKPNVCMPCETAESSHRSLHKTITTEARCCKKKIMPSGRSQ